MSDFDFVESLIGADLMEEGAFCQFLHPQTGEPLYLPNSKRADGTYDPDKAVGVYVRSTASRAFAQWQDELLRRAVGNGRRAKTEAQKEEVALKQIKSERPEKFVVLVTRFQNTASKAPGVSTPSDDEKRALAQNPNLGPILDRIFAFAEDMANYPAGNDPAA